VALVAGVAPVAATAPVIVKSASLTLVTPTVSAAPAAPTLVKTISTPPPPLIVVPPLWPWIFTSAAGVETSAVAGAYPGPARWRGRASLRVAILLGPTGCDGVGPAATRSRAARPMRVQFRGSRRYYCTR